MIIACVTWRCKALKQKFADKKNLKTKCDFRLKIFLKYTKIAFENNAFPKIKITLGNFKFVILGRI